MNSILSEVVAGDERKKKIEGEKAVNFISLTFPTLFASRVLRGDEWLSVEEQKLLSVAYKNVIGSLRAAWRIVSSIEQKEEGKRNDELVVLVKEYKSKIETELSAVCAGVLAILDFNLVPSAASSESKIARSELDRSSLSVR
ncbi:unnamed protein product [Linum tenue]|uniref:14-3-3 domain-containing protein n=1 Tax=Linum tenue TaxID=586396 RepID=A0AAV0RL18_9ROSI|nr:unnamed protein product [Linum tenue]